MKSIYFFICFSSLSGILYAQNVGIGTSSPNASAKMDISSTNSGLLIPRVALTMTTAAGPITAPATSLMVYNTATVTDVTPGYYFWDGTKWVRFASGTQPYWSLLGNSGTSAASNFIGTTDVIDFVTRTNNLERMRVTSGGNVGIGITVPTQKLDVQGGNARINNVFIGDVGFGATWGGISHSSQSNTAGYALISSSDGNYTLINKQNTGAGFIGFRVGNTDQAVITNAGNMGIGTTSPGMKLDVVGLGGTNVDVRTNGRFWSNSTSGGLWLSNLQDGLVGNISATQLGFWTSSVGWNAFNINKVNGNIGIGTSAPNQRLTVRGSLEIEDMFDNTFLSRNTANARNIHVIGTYMGWDSRGVFLAGYNLNNNGGSYSDAQRIYCGGPAGTLPISATAFTVTSSRRFKSDIEPLKYGLATIMQLNPVQFKYNFEVLQQTHVGLIAEEVNSIVPEIVPKKNDKGEETININGEAMGINYTELTPILIKAVQEQQLQIEELKKQNQELQKRLETLEHNQ